MSKKRHCDGNVSDAGPEYVQFKFLEQSLTQSLQYGTVTLFICQIKYLLHL